MMMDGKSSREMEGSTHDDSKSNSTESSSENSFQLPDEDEDDYYPSDNFQDDSDSSDSSLQPSPSHFRTFFEIIKSVGGGGFGAVWLCQHTLTKQRYAVKRIILPESRLDRISREAEILSKLEHRNVVSYNHCWHEPCTELDKADNKEVMKENAEDWDEEEEPLLSFYICMQYCHSSLKEEIKCNTELDPYGIAVQLADGLRYIHESEVVHGDLSCQNVLMYGDTPKIADFGLAALLNDGDDDEDDEVYPSMIGNVLYLAPEQRNGPPLLTKMSDIYSLGIIFFELFFTRRIHTDMERFGLIKTFKGENEFPEGKVDDVDVVSLIERMTVHDPNSRMDIEEVSGEVQRLNSRLT